MATTLGLSFFFHDSAAAVVRDGRVLAAVAEERFCRRKHTNEFPKRAIEYCLEAAGVSSVNDLDAVVFYEKPLIKFVRVMETLIATWPRSLVNFSRRLPAYLGSKFNVYRAIERNLSGYRGPILFTEHHLSHAASAFFCSPFAEAAILTMDGVGEWETTAFGMGHGRELQLERTIHFPHSLGLLYSALTSYLGFRVNDGEWKVMGLAPYGEPTYDEQFRRLVELKADGSFRLNMEFFVHHFSSQWTAHHGRWEKLFGFPRRHPEAPIEQHHENLARSGQKVVEDIILSLASEAKRSSGSDNLVIAGGVGLNSVANWRIEKEGIFKNVWIQPAAGDDGGALGAALLVSQQLFNDESSPELKDVYLGPEFTGDEVRCFLENKQIPYEQLKAEEIVPRVADALAAGQVAGWFQGRMEFGPRSLGTRSILADATNADMKAIINRKIKYREYFRPFAPVVPLEHVHEYFDVPPGTEMPFMLKVPAVRLEKRRLIPAVTHEDGSGRVQTITEAANPLYYRLVKAMIPRTGVPVLLNTSFNVRGEPIVLSPEDAYQCFINSGIDLLILGDCLVTAKPADALDINQGYARSDLLERRLGRDAENEPISRDSILESTSRESRHDQLTQEVLSFYTELPFNYYSNAIDTANELRRGNRIKAYPCLHQHLRRHRSLRVLDAGCGAGWFVNSCAHFYGHYVTGVDVNPVALRQGRSVARLMTGCERVQYIKTDLFDFTPPERFDVANSLGVLHHTPDCHAAICRILDWVAPSGYLHLGLYHRYGRLPFLEHFANLRARGADEPELFAEFARLNPELRDATHLRSWFRDQVLHPHETQHTFEEINQLLAENGFVIEATSLNRFKRLPSLTRLVGLERRYADRSYKALRRGRFSPGFFVVWARRQ
jgi:carbamoyltransferase